MSWSFEKKLNLLLSEEKSFVPTKSFRSVPVNVVLAYPNTYALGMSNLGFHSIYREINYRDDALCHRAFLSLSPGEDEIKAMESGQTIGSYDLIGFSVSFEMDYINILRVLDYSQIPLLAKEREHGPLIMGGGPVITFNPEPLTPFFDFFVIGEGEEVIYELINTYKLICHKPKREILEALSQIEGIYVPSLYNISYNDKGGIENIKIHSPAPPVIKKRWIRNLDDYNTESVILTPNTEFKNMFLLEISRGCGRNCRFCMAGYCYRVPRTRSVEKVLERAEFGARNSEKIGLVGAAISDYPYIDKLSEELMRLNIKFSVSSLRADSLGESLMCALHSSGHRTLTIAPEAGSERLRKVINKGITEQHVLDSIKLAHKFGVENIKLYYIIGLPTETDEDIQEMIRFLTQIKKFMQDIGNKSGLLSISINPFIPKPFTPFQWYGMEPVPRINSKLKVIKSSLKPLGIRVINESPRLSEIQSALSRGDRLTGMLLYEIYKDGDKSSSYKKADIKGKNIEYYAHRQLAQDMILPWEHLNIGLEKDYFISELKKAQSGIFTRRCTDEVCRVCGICRHK